MISIVSAQQFLKTPNELISPTISTDFSRQFLNGSSNRNWTVQVERSGVFAYTSKELITRSGVEVTLGKRYHILEQGETSLLLYDNRAKTEIGWIEKTSLLLTNTPIFNQQGISTVMVAFDPSNCNVLRQRSNTEKIDRLLTPGVKIAYLLKQDEEGVLINFSRKNLEDCFWISKNNIVILTDRKGWVFNFDIQEEDQIIKLFQTPDKSTSYSSSNGVYLNNSEIVANAFPEINRNDSFETFETLIYNDGEFRDVHISTDDENLKPRILLSNTEIRDLIDELETLQGSSSNQEIIEELKYPNDDYNIGLFDFFQRNLFGFKFSDEKSNSSIQKFLDDETSFEVFQQKIQPILISLERLKNPQLSEYTTPYFQDNETFTWLDPQQLGFSELNINTNTTIEDQLSIIIYIKENDREDQAIREANLNSIKELASSELFQNSNDLLFLYPCKEESRSVCFNKNWGKFQSDYLFNHQQTSIGLDVLLQLKETIRSYLIYHPSRSSSIKSLSLHFFLPRNSYSSNDATRFKERLLVNLSREIELNMDLNKLELKIYNTPFPEELKQELVSQGLNPKMIPYE